MENEITNPEPTTESQLVVKPESHKILEKAAKWASFLGIVGYVASGLIVLVALILFIVSLFVGSVSNLGNDSPFNFGIPFGIMALLYLIIGAVSFLPAYYLRSFSQKTQTALTTQHQESLDKSFVFLKRLFSFYGILTIVIISLYIIMIPVALITGFSHAMHY